MNAFQIANAARERHASISAEQEQELFRQMKNCQRMFEYAINGMSGADQTDSEMHAIDRRVYVAIWANGLDGLEPALAAAKAEWQRYATEINARHANAPKIKRGPSSGLSSMSHRWASPDKFSDAHANHLRFMARKILGIEVST